IGTALGGNFTMQQGTMNVTASRFMILGENAATSMDYTQTGGTATFTPTDTAGFGLYIGNITSGANKVANFTISGGSYTLSGVNTAVIVGRAQTSATAFTGNLTIGGGVGSATFTAPTIHIGGAGANTINTGNVTLLNNGTLTTL